MEELKTIRARAMKSTWKRGVGTKGLAGSDAIITGTSKSPKVWQSLFFSSFL